MTRAFGIGRLAGVRIEIDWTWLVVATLVTWSLADVVFPEQSPGLGAGSYWAMAIAGTLVFFGSLLLHELGHAIQARREGMEIEGITLWLFGGVARFRGAFPSAGAEFRIAIAGPAVTAALIVLYGALASLGLPTAIDALLVWLTSINVVLLVFNMLPGLPLDGGRVARSAIWAATGDFDRATRMAGAGGQALAYGLMGLGVGLTFVTGTASGIWLAIVGWFLLGAARGELEHATLTRHLAGVTVADLMVRDPVTAPAEMSLDRFLDEIVWPHRYSSYPVIGAGGQLIGLLAFRRVAAVPRGQLNRHTVGQHAQPMDSVVALGPSTTIMDAIDAMTRASAGRALVLENGQLTGLLSSTDVLRAVETLRATEGDAPGARGLGQAPGR